MRSDRPTAPRGRAHRFRPSLRALLLVVVVALVSGCAVGERPQLAEVRIGVEQPDGSGRNPGSNGDPGGSLAAVVGPEIGVYDSPALTGDPTTLPTALEGSAPRSTVTVAVTGRDGDAVEILTGRLERGWVPAESVDIVAVPVSITVDLDRGVLTLVEEDEETEFPVVTGDGLAASAGSDLFVADLLALPPQVDTPWGSLLYVLAGSTVAQANLLGGDGVLGMYAISDPGEPVPAEGIGLSSEDFAALEAAGIALGTPVRIEP